MVFYFFSSVITPTGTYANWMGKMICQLIPILNLKKTKLDAFNVQNIWKKTNKKHIKIWIRFRKKLKYSQKTVGDFFFSAHQSISIKSFSSSSQAVKLFFICCFTDWQMREREVLWKDTTGG